MPNPFLPRSPGGGTSTDRSASNPLNLIKPPFFAKNSAIVFEPLFRVNTKFRSHFVASSISSSYSFLEFHLCTCFKTTPWLVMGPYCKLLPFFGVFFSQTPIILFSQKLTNFGRSEFRSFEKKILSFEMLPPFGDCYVQLKSSSVPDLFAILIIRSNKK